MGEDGGVGVDCGRDPSLVVAAMSRSAGLATLLAVTWILAVPVSADANGHGPVFGLATPTNVEDGWTLDTTFLGRGGGGDNMATFGTMLTTGSRPTCKCPSSRRRC